MARRKRILIIAGPNGAGKTTFARTYFEKDSAFIFINADIIAREINPIHPENAAIAAARLMLELTESLANEGRSFALETTLSGTGYEQRIRRWRSKGYIIQLIYLSLPSPEHAIERVRQRVLEGGHGIEEAVIRRRFASGLSNLHNKIKELADVWAIYDTSTRSPVLIEKKH